MNGMFSFEVNKITDQRLITQNKCLELGIFEKSNHV